MRVPHSVVGRTQRPDTAQTTYVSDAGAKGLASLSVLGQSIAGLGAKLEERNLKTQRFAAMADFSAFETEASRVLTDMKRNTGPTESNFPDQVNATYDDMQRKFIATLDPSVQEEFMAQGANLKGKIIADAMKFQYDSQDAYYVKSIDTEYQKSLTALDPSLGGDPSKLEAEKKRLQALIGASDLPDNPAEGGKSAKSELATQIARGLEGVTYKSKVKDLIIANNTGSGGVAAILRKEEGFRETPYWDTNAYRIGYGSDTVTRKDGSVVKVTQGMKITKADAERDLARRAIEFENTAKGQVGADAWGALSGNARAALVSVTYNYGSLPKSVVAAIKSGDVGAVADAVEALGSNKGRRKKEAAIIRGGGEPTGGDTIDQDPAFSSLTYEERTALRNDAETEANQQLAKQKAATTAAYNAQYNTLLNSLNDGTAGHAALDKARANGWLTDYDDIHKAETILAEREKGLKTLTGGQQKLSDEGAIWDPSSEDDKKMQNALFGQAGPTAFKNNDQAYVTQGLIPMVQRTHDIPTDAVGMLTGMVRSNDPKRMAYAYNTLALLAAADPAAFAARTSDALAKDVMYYADRKDSVPAEELMKKLRGGTDPSEIQLRKQLRDEGMDILSAKTKGVPHIRELVSEVAGGMDTSWRNDPTNTALPWAAAGLEKDFRAVFIDAYEMRGNEEEATAAATEMLKRNWGVTPIGGTNQLMKYPPERVGYPKVSGTYDWIDRQVRSMANLEPDAKFQLLSDDQTAEEVGKSKSGAALPSYRVIKFDVSGAPYVVTSQAKGHEGEDMRVTFVPTVEDQAEERRSYDLRRAELEYTAAKAKRLKAEDDFANMGQALPDEFKQEEEAARQRVIDLQPSTPPSAPADTGPMPTDPAYDTLGNPTGF